MTSKNWLNENTPFIAERFPNCVTETEDGLKVDFELLQQELSGDVVTGSKERYRLEWPGKRQAMVNANLPTTKTLRPVREDSVDFDNTENLYIEGDNLEVLKILQESYLGKIKMIYIDPPYNTGKDFVYKDNFTQDSKEYKEESGQTDEYNRRLVSNPETSGRYHSDWLSMMYPRLKLARNLLTEDGVIFMSIDDTEVQNLRKAAEEVFGETNFVANIIWEKKYSPANDAKWLSDNHDHILLFAKNKEKWRPEKLPRTEDQNNRYTNRDNDHRGSWKAGDLTVKTYNAKYDYPITTPSGRIINLAGGSCWRVSKERFSELLAENRIWFGEKGDNVPSIKRFLSDVSSGIVPLTIWKYQEVGHNQEGRQELKKLFDGQGYFDSPKPVRLLDRCLTIANLTPDDLVLDFFSGSGSTAHAVMNHNAKTSKKLRYIMVQLPESIDEKSDAFKAGYKVITDIGRDRIKRATAKIKEETGADIDYGFKVYRVDESNMKEVYYRPQDLTQRSMDMFASNIKADRTSEDLLTQVLLDWGLPLTLKTEKATLAGKEVFKVAGDSLYASFDDELGEAFAKAVAEEKPLRLVVKDSAFASDTAKVNVQQLLKQLSPNTDLKVL
jgi:adenine-specific DNA-methyltransferase